VHLIHQRAPVQVSSGSHKAIHHIGVVPAKGIGELRGQFADEGMLFINRWEWMVAIHVVSFA